MCPNWNEIERIEPQLKVTVLLYSSEAFACVNKELKTDRTFVILRCDELLKKNKKWKKGDSERE